MLTISGKALGRKKPLFADWSIPLPPGILGGGSLTLREVITRIVEEETAAFRQRQSERQFLRALTARDISAGLEKGKIQMGETEVPLHEVDDGAAVGTALQAFEDGLYLVVIDDQEQRNLESEVSLGPDSKITFIRLTLLAGG
jgi:hypothetical protein